MGSVAVADVPDSPLSTPCRDATLSHVLAVCCLSEHVCFDALHGGEDHGVGLALLNDEPVAYLVTVLQVGGKFVCHGSIVQGQGRSLWVMVDGSATEQHVSDLVHGVHVGTHQGEGALRANLPDGAVVAVVCFPLFGDRLSTLQGWRVVCPILVKGAPCGGLNGVHAQLRLNDLIIEARPLPRAT